MFHPKIIVAIPTAFAIVLKYRYVDFKAQCKKQLAAIGLMNATLSGEVRANDNCCQER
jgi:hypothetical protein